MDIEQKMGPTWARLAARDSRLRDLLETAVVVSDEGPIDDLGWSAFLIGFVVAGRLAGQDPVSLDEVMGILRSEPGVRALVALVDDDTFTRRLRRA